MPTLPTLPQPDVAAPPVTEYVASSITDMPDQTEQVATRHRTLIPRTLCFAGALGWFALPAFVVVLFDAGRAEVGDNGVLTLDDESLVMVSQLALLATTVYLLGWLWWATVAAFNARNISRHTLWPGTPLVAFLVQVGAVAAGEYLVLEGDLATTAVDFGVVAVIVTAHFLVVAFRRTAGAIRAPQAPWTRMIALPWAAFAFNVVLAFFMGFVSRSLAVAAIGSQVAILGWYVISFYQAMTGFDRACVGRAILGQDDQAFAKFLKQQR